MVSVFDIIPNNFFNPLSSNSNYRTNAALFQFIYEQYDNEISYRIKRNILRDELAYYISEHSEDLLSDSDMSNKSYQDISSDYLRKFASKDVGWLEEEFDETTFEKYIVITEQGVMLAELLIRLERPEREEEVFINTDVELDIFEDAFRSAIERNVRIIVFSFVTSHSAISEVEVYSHERERRPENTDSRIMIVADEKLVMIADADNARGNWSGTVSNNKLMKDVVREHIHNDIYMLKLRNIFGKEIYEKIHLHTSQETKSCQEVKK